MIEADSSPVRERPRNKGDWLFEHHWTGIKGVEEHGFVKEKREGNHFLSGIYTLL